MKSKKQNKVKNQIDTAKVQKNKQRRALQQFKNKLNGYVNKETNLYFNRETGRTTYVLPQTLVEMCWKTNLSHMLRMIMEKEGAANIEARALGMLRDQIKTVMSEMGISTAKPVDVQDEDVERMERGELLPPPAKLHLPQGASSPSKGETNATERASEDS